MMTSMRILAIILAGAAQAWAQGGARGANFGYKTALRVDPSSPRLGAAKISLDPPAPAASLPALRASVPPTSPVNPSPLPAPTARALPSLPGAAAPGAQAPRPTFSLSSDGAAQPQGENKAGKIYAHMAQTGEQWALEKTDGLKNAHGAGALNGRFGRMFPSLPPRAAVGPKPEELGKLGGPMDGGRSRNLNPRIAAGFTYVGQFLDHDITFDPTSSLDKPNDPGSVDNFRTPSLELDSVYGLGPMASPHLYDKSNPAKLLVGPSDQDQFDVPRNHQGRALLGDPRNDENLIVSQLHTAFLKLHNKLVDVTKDFAEAQRLTRWHYQWMIVHEFLPMLVGQSLVDDILANGRKFYQWTDRPFIPVEFSVAAYRFGHSQVLPTYLINGGFAAPLFPDDPQAPAGNDLRGDRPIAKEHTVDWSVFFDMAPGGRFQAGNKIDAKLAQPLLRLPDTVVGAGTPEALRSLATRNLARGDRMGLPSGQDVARFMGESPLTDEELWADVRAQGLAVETDAAAPLWYYVLKEAEKRAEGLTLGPVGGRIVAEVILGLLQGDPRSFLNADPAWKPTLPAQQPGTFTMADLLRFVASPLLS